MKLATLRYVGIGIPIMAMAIMLFAPNAVDSFDYQGDNDLGYRVVTDREGNVYAAGTGLSDSNGKDFILVKYNSSLVYQWDVSYDGPGHGNDDLTGLALDSSGNVFISGTSTGSSGLDVAVVGFYPNGTLIWGTGDGAQRYNSSGSQPDIANDMVIDVSGNIAICGSTTPTGSYADGLVIVFEPDGDIKSGWPQTIGGGDDEYVFNCISTSSANRVVAAGYFLPEGVSEDKDFLFKQWSGSGSGISEYTYDYQGKNDEAVDIAYGIGTNIAVAVNVYTSGNENRGSVWHFSDGDDGYGWQQIYASESRFNAITTDGTYDYAVGSEGEEMLTVKLVDANGNYSTTWASAGDGVGIRVYHGSYSDAVAMSVHTLGSGVTLTGAAVNPNDTTPQYAHYLTLAYTKNGGLLVEQYYPAGDPTTNDIGYSVNVFGRGYIVVTGDLYEEVEEDQFHNMGTLLYILAGDENDPSSSTIEVGSSG